MNSKISCKAIGFLVAMAVSFSSIGSAFPAGPRPPKPRSRAEVETVLAKAPKVREGKLRRLNVVLLADVKDHGENEHDYPLWQKRWALLLGGEAASDEKQVNLFGPPQNDKEIDFGAPNVKLTTAWSWPSDEQFETADVIVAFCYLRWNAERFEQMRKYLEKGGGLVPVHPASWPDSKHFVKAAELLGIGGYQKYRHGPLEFKITKPDHPICLGLPQTLHFYDETYWPPTPIMDDVTILATSDEKVNDKAKKKPQPVFWTYEYGKGRVFGCQPGHYTWTFDDPYFRILLLRGTAWAAGESPYRFDDLVVKGVRLAGEKPAKTTAAE